MLWAVVAAAAAVAAAVLWRRGRAEPNKNTFRIPCPPKDTVILQQFGPGLHVPSISPFVLKLETFLRAADIPYQNKFDKKMGPKSKIPWIQYNDDVIADSEHVIEYLQEKRNVKLGGDLSKEQKAIGHVIRRTVEEFSYWILCQHRLQYDGGSLYRRLGLPGLVVWYLQHVNASRAAAQGVGRHSRAAVDAMLKADLGAVSCLLGGRRFLCGDARGDVTAADCALFGQLAEIFWEAPGCPAADMAIEHFPNLLAFCEAMKAEFWPDWEARLLPNTQAGRSLAADTASASDNPPCQINEENKNNI